MSLFSANLWSIIRIAPLDMKMDTILVHVHNAPRRWSRATVQFSSLSWDFLVPVQDRCKERSRLLATKACTTGRMGRLARLLRVPFPASNLLTATDFDKVGGEYKAVTNGPTSMFAAELIAA